MKEHKGIPPDIRQIIAADHRCGEINPDNDQVWELNTSRGEPPAVALQTTYGLRAYGMRVFPRFTQNKIPVSDPHAFSIRPALEFSAPNFVSLTYSPIQCIDVNQKVWVPDSQTLVGQITINNTTGAMIQLEMEWVVQLNPLFSGTSMTATQISVNTVLQGQTQHLYPVFFLTGGPRGSSSAFPGLGIEMSLAPFTSRQFSWALASLNSVDASFYSARKTTAYALDNIQIKMQMLQKQQTIDFDFDNHELQTCLQQSQQKIFQLLMPPYREFDFVSYVENRLPDQGFRLSDNEQDLSSGWGIQRINEVWEISRMLLPLRPDLVKELVQNLLDQQGDNGSIYAQTGWDGKITGLLAAPLLVSLVLDIHESMHNENWLSQVYPALVRSIRIWFSPEQDQDGDGYPEWKHLLQTGITESVQFDRPSKIRLQTLVQAAEWPSLAAMLLKECQGLIKIANLLEETTDAPWLEEKIDRLKSTLQQSWDEEQAFYLYRDKETHLSPKGKILHTFKQNGSVKMSSLLPTPVRIVIRLKPLDGNNRLVECRIKGTVNQHEKVVLISGKQFHHEEEMAYAVTEELFSKIDQITVTGIKKGDQLTVELPDFNFRSPDFVIPLWAGVPSTEQAGKMISAGIEYLAQPLAGFPLFLKIMWLEGLQKYGRQELACRFFRQWFLKSFEMDSDVTGLDQTSIDLGQINLSSSSLQNLLPIQTLLQLLGIAKISENELLLKGFNIYFPKVNVQYKKYLLELEAAQTRITTINGESHLITDPGIHRINLS